ncbi:bactofilin family protein [Novilysobacter erysipheiresistens]|uniref:bactofilin family protein n=1 Tax=Novilysobacter erysipheiresistens TaxID=1749332 RepID=UPI003CE4A5D8
MLKNKSSNVPAGQIDTLIGPQVVIRGDLQFSGGLHIEGRVIGKVFAEDGQQAMLTLAQNGSIEGEIHAPVVVINGRVDGDIHSSERMELASKARVQGNVHYKVVEMAAGSILSGRLLHVESMEPAGHGEVTQFRGGRAAELPEAEAMVDVAAIGR